MTEDRPQWKKTLGLAEDSTRVQITCKEKHKEAWTKEAEERGRSRSSYLYELIEEARAYRNEGFLGWEHAQERIEDLEAEVERLEHELEEQKEASQTTLSDSATVKRHLSSNYRPLEEIVEEFLKNEELERVLQPVIVDTLSVLADQDEVEFQRGHGWRLIDKGGK